MQFYDDSLVILFDLDNRGIKNEYVCFSIALNFYLKGDDEKACDYAKKYLSFYPSGEHCYECDEMISVCEYDAEEDDIYFSEYPESMQRKDYYRL